MFALGGAVGEQGFPGRESSAAVLGRSLSSLGIRIVIHEVSTVQERDALKFALEKIRGGLTDIPTLNDRVVRNQHLFNTTVDGSRPLIRKLEISNRRELTHLDELPLDETVPVETVRVVPVSETQRDSLGQVNVKNLSKMGIRFDIREVDSPWMLEHLTQSLNEFKGEIRDHVTMARFNSIVDVVHGLRDRELDAYDHDLARLMIPPDPSRYRPMLLSIPLRPSFDFDARFPDIAHHSPVFLENKFRRSVEKFALMQYQIATLPGDPYRDLRRDLTVVAMQYLVHSAMVTVSSGRETPDLPALEFRGPHVNTDGQYHRLAANGAILKLFKELLAVSGHPFSDVLSLRSKYPSDSEPYGAAKNRVDTVVVVDGPGVIDTMGLSYRGGIQALPDQSDGALAARLSVQPTRSQLIDVSLYFQDPPGGLPLTDMERRTRLDTVRGLIGTSPAMNSRSVVAQFPVAGVTVAIAFDTGNDAQKKLITFANAGSRADIVKLRSAVAELAGIDGLVQRLPMVPARPEPVIDGTHLASPDRFSDAVIGRVFAKVQDGLLERIAALPGTKESLYYGLCEQLLRFAIDNRPCGIPNIINSHLFDTLGRMSEIVVDMRSVEGDHSNFVRHVDLMVEETIHLMALMNVRETNIPALLNPINTVAPPGSTKHSYIFNSGMKSLECILTGIGQMRMGGHHPSGAAAKLSVGSFPDNYFESRVLLRDHNGAHLRDLEKLDMQVDEFGKDVVFFDPLPNAAAYLTGVREYPPVETVTRAITGRTPANPVTVVVDATTDIFDGARTQAILSDPAIAAAIGEGTLNLVVMDSLAKFAQAGRDKYTGGVVQVYNNGDAAHPYFNDFNQALDVQLAAPSNALSLFANRLFAATLDPAYARPSVMGHLMLVRQATNSVSWLLRADPDPVLGLGGRPLVRSDGYVPVIELLPRHMDSNGIGDVPMLGLCFNPLKDGIWSRDDSKNNRLFTLIHHYLLSVAQAKNLEMSTRGSFGFDHATLAPAVPPETMRLTIGLEGDSAELKYANLLRTASDAIGGYFGDKGSRESYFHDSVGIDQALRNPEKRTKMMQHVAAYFRDTGTDIPIAEFVDFCKTLIL